MFFYRDTLTRDINGNFITNRKRKQNQNFHSYDFQYKRNSNYLTIEEINKIKKQEMEKAFQLENLKQMEERAKKKEIDKKMRLIQEELDEGNLLVMQNSCKKNIR